MRMLRVGHSFWSASDTHIVTADDPAVALCGWSWSSDAYFRPFESNRWPSCKACRRAAGLLDPFERAELKGAQAHGDGLSLSDNPYKDHRTYRGSTTFSRGFIRAWDRGFREAENGGA